MDSNNISKFLASIENDFISISDVIDLLHKKIGLDKDISQVYQVLAYAIQKTEVKPNVYKKDKFNGWQKGVFLNGSWNSFIAKAYVQENEKQNTLSIAIDIERYERETSDLPF